MVHTKRDTSRTLFPYKSSLQPIGPSSCTLLGWFRLPSIDQYSSLLPPVGDLPLRTPTDRRLGGPLPRRLPNQTHPHPLAINLCSILDVCIGKHRVLIRLSPGYPLLRARLDTRYSPVRRSPSEFASKLHAAPRLACVKPVASVHPEPGSNSSL